MKQQSETLNPLFRTQASAEALRQMCYAAQFELALKQRKKQERIQRFKTRFRGCIRRTKNA